MSFRACCLKVSALSGSQDLGAGTVRVPRWRLCEKATDVGFWSADGSLPSSRLPGSDILLEDSEKQAVAPAPFDEDVAAHAPLELHARFL